MININLMNDLKILTPKHPSQPIIYGEYKYASMSTEIQQLTSKFAIQNYIITSYIRILEISKKFTENSTISKESILFDDSAEDVFIDFDDFVSQFIHQNSKVKSGLYNSKHYLSALKKPLSFSLNPVRPHPILQSNCQSKTNSFLKTFDFSKKAPSKSEPIGLCLDVLVNQNRIQTNQAAEKVKMAKLALESDIKKKKTFMGFAKEKCSKTQNDFFNRDTVKKFPKTYYTSHDNFFTSDSIQHNIFLKQKDLQTVLSVSGKHLNNEIQSDVVKSLVKHQQNLKTIYRLICNWYRTHDPGLISQGIIKLTKQNDTMKDICEMFDKDLDELYSKHKAVSILVNKAATDNNGMERILNEGIRFYDQEKQHLTAKKREIKELDMQNKAIAKAIKKIGTIFQTKKSKTLLERAEAKQLDEVQTLVFIVDEILKILHKNKTIMTTFKNNQKSFQSNKKSNFQIVDSTSSMKKIFNLAERSQGVMSSVIMPNSQADSADTDNNSGSSTALNSHSSLFDPTPNLLVPGIALNSNSSIPEFIPGTRSTRRAFSAMGSLRNIDTEQDDVDQELSLIGKITGYILVERYASKFFGYKEKVCLVEKDDISLELDHNLDIKLKCMSIKEILDNMFELYKRYRAYLYLLVYSIDDINTIDKSFLKFISLKDQYIKALSNNFDNAVFMKEVSAFLLLDDIASAWLIHDLVLSTNAKIMIPQLVQKMSPLFQRFQNTISPTMDREQTLLFIPWLNCFTVFIKSKTIPGINQNFASICTENLAKLVPLYTRSQNSAQGHAGLFSLFQFGVFLPHIFSSFVQFQNKSTTILHNFLRRSISYPAHVKVATDFFVASWRFLDEEIMMWHTALFYHFIISEIAKQPLNDQNLYCFLQVMTLIVANRQKFTMEQLGRLNFISFLIFNFNLEETVDLNKKATFYSKKSVTEETNATVESPQEKKSEFQTLTPLSNQKVSYLDLPKFDLNNTKETKNSFLLPSLNLENPKLQLHFQSLAIENSNKGNMLTITMNDYMIKRKKYPIYATSKIHTSFIQLVFATIIDHSLHRLDVFFCDPFPQVNRKPNVLFTLMRHLEMKENYSIASNLKDAFTSNSPLSEIVEPSMIFDDMENNLQSNEEADTFLLSLGNNSIENSQVSPDRNMEITMQDITETGKSKETTRRIPPLRRSSDQTFLKSRYVSGNNDLSLTLKPITETHINAMQSLNVCLLETVTEENEDGTVNIRDQKNQQQQFNTIPMIQSSSTCSNLPLQTFRSVPNFIAATNEDDIIIGSSVRQSIRDQVAREAFLKDRESHFRDYQRLLKMFVPELFHYENYKNGTHIASGAFGAVMAVTYKGQLYAVKVLEKSRNKYDNPHLVEVYTEVSILENCKNDRRVTQLFDYGSTKDSYYIVMEFYPSTLKSWRKKYTEKKEKPPENMLLRLFREFLKAVTVLTERRINHFDIKCDNVMLDKNGYPALADFGEAMCYKNESNWATLLNKGTEWIKSPEMLSIALNSSATNPNYDRRKQVGAGPESDIWSIGCLFFELMTGEFLFVDSDWSRFFLRITDPKKSLLTEESKTLLDHNEKYISFLEFVLQRSVRHRPNLKQVIVKFDEMFPHGMNGPLPVLEMPNFQS